MYFSTELRNMFCCELCNIRTTNKKDYKKHLLTTKHQMATLCNTSSSSQSNDKTIFVCKNCDNRYHSRSGLWKHRQICSVQQPPTPPVAVEGFNKEMFTALLKDHQELKQLIIQVIQKESSNTNIANNSHNNNTHTNNSHNKTFNLNMYLNETCKDAMNMADFVSSVKVSLEDLENTGRHGYIQGISHIIITELNKLEQHLRPLHCSDSKREVLYIKENNEWTKDTDAKPILTKAIKTIANENIKQISKWTTLYPDCVHADSKKNKLYLNIVSNSMNGLTKEEGDKNIQKIISNIAKEVIIDKSR